VDPGAFSGQRQGWKTVKLSEGAKDASVSECTWTLSALEALHNALYKFKTYLLTYLPQEDPQAVHCFCVCSGSVLLGDLLGVS